MSEPIELGAKLLDSFEAAWRATFDAGKTHDENVVAALQRWESTHFKNKRPVVMDDDAKKFAQNATGYVMFGLTTLMMTMDCKGNLYQYFHAIIDDDDVEFTQHPGSKRVKPTEE